ncbi:hypothetical protein D9619_001142 [Psilocybe cf. subviscida]|uniref:Uncharacterized protein n=1 Tax=Psilocybe cf. subviscida TaxID=2480587 RepID=A0A8H5F3L1_9AGAR|nr:hypothetical protein D9619_001142 [Psilocybe cf. subviscida]
MAPCLLSILQFAILLPFAALIHAQNISTSPVPPLQWINLSGLLQGINKPPPLKNAAIGYDETSRSIIIFGGISSSGIPQSQTYLLNLDSLSWSTPSPPANLKRTPSARSEVVSGRDSAASNRRGFVIVGGKDVNGAALSDIWEFDFTNQFWSSVGLSPGGPSARWGASGGIDPRVMPISDPILPGPNNTFYLAGGFDGQKTSPLSDAWELSLSGTLSSNMPDSVNGSWLPVTIGKLPGRIEQAGTVVGQQIIAAGGCDSNTPASAVNSSCAQQDSFVINAENESAVTPNFCAAPRAGPVLVSNQNAFSQNFASQVFLLLGTLDTTLWDDSNGLAHGEVAVLDINAGTWTRVLPSGDPSSSGTQQFPSPREGAAAFSFTQGLVGSSRSNFADTIVFGGQDNSGTFLADMWLLRSYSGVVSPTSPNWTGFGNGQLTTGVDANGAGVSVKYLNQCASRISTPTSSSTAPSSTKTGPSKTSIPNPSSSPITVVHPHQLETAFSHKLLLPLSLVLLLPFFLFLRWWDKVPQLPIHERTSPPVVVASIAGLAAYGLGLAGFVLSFTTIHTNTNTAVQETSSRPTTHLNTAHGIVGLIFFISLYVLVPLLYLLKIARAGTRAHADAVDARSQRTDSGKSTSLEVDDKTEVRSEAATSTGQRARAPSSDTRPRSMNASLLNSLSATPAPASPPPPRARSMSWDAFTALRPSKDKDESGLSAEGSEASALPPTSYKGFEVTNRPNRARKTSEPWGSVGRTHTHTHTAPGSSQHTGQQQELPATRKLGEIDWLLRRRSLNAVGELDFAITQAHNAQYYANKNAGGATHPAGPPVVFPSHPSTILRHFLLQTSILGLCALTLSALWTRAPRYLFALFLIWTIAYLLGMLLLAYHGRPASPSFLSTTVWRLQGSHVAQNVEAPPYPGSPPVPVTPGPYRYHRPPVRPASTGLDEQSHLHSPLSVGTDDNDDDDDMDEDTRQRLIEEEMERRDVSIVTVPRRKLVLANPS